MKIDLNIRTFLSLIFLLFAVPVYSQSNQQAEMLQAKAYLESLIVQRLSQDLSTQVQKDDFSISAFLNIRKIEKKKKDLDPISDIDLGFLNPDQLYKEFKQDKDGMENYFSNFQVTKVTVNVGLKASLGEEAKEEITKWLDERVKAEFGRIGQASVKTILGPKVAEKSPFLDLLKDLQELAGMLILAMALLMGVMLWKAMSGKPSEVNGGGPDIKINNGGAGAGKGGADGSSEQDVSSDQKLVQERNVNEKIEKVSEQIREIAPKMLSEFEGVITEWCKAGEGGFMQTALLAQTVGQVLGKIPIPDKYHKEVVKYFTTMHSVEPEKKLEYLTALYWDLMAVMNLGSSALYKPFSYLNDAPVTTVNEVLMENNSRLRTVASFYMSDERRAEYLETLDEEMKFDMLKEAAELDHMKESEFQTMDQWLSAYFNQDGVEADVAMESILPKLVESLSLREGVTFLKEIKGRSVEVYKRSVPSLAFFHEWNKDYLGGYLSRLASEELIAFLSIRQDLQDTFLEYVPPRMKIIVGDDLKRGAEVKPEEQEIQLRSMLDKLEEMVRRGDLKMSSVFPPMPEKVEEEDDTEVPDVA